MKEKDLYAALGVARTATTEQIKKAYRKLARKHHPDVNPGNPTAEERFKEISEAHDILSDPDKRKLYDEFGMAGVQAGFDPDRARGFREWQQRAGTESPDMEGGFGGYTRFEDIFGDIFGQAGAGRAPQGRGADFESELEISLMDAIRGVSTTVSLQRPEECPVCKGEGVDTAGASTCPECKGQGRVRVAGGPIGFTRTCPRCGGRGQIGLRPCSNCGGAGHVMKTEKLTVRIPPGVETGSRVRVAAKGGGGAGGGPSGDLYIRVRVRPHPLLERKGDDLYMEVPVTVREALLGESITVPTPDGVVRVKIPAGSQSGRLLRVKGHGVPHLKGNGRGELYLRLMVHVPDDASDAIRAAGEALEAGYRRSPRESLKL